MISLHWLILDIIMWLYLHLTIFPPATLSLASASLSPLSPSLVVVELSPLAGLYLFFRVRSKQNTALSVVFVFVFVFLGCLELSPLAGLLCEKNYPETEVYSLTQIDDDGGNACHSPIDSVTVSVFVFLYLI